MITACDVCKPCINKTGLNCVAKEVIEPIPPLYSFHLQLMCLQMYFLVLLQFSSFHSPKL